jgi:hypothetical protein
MFVFKKWRKNSQTVSVILKLLAISGGGVIAVPLRTIEQLEEV